MLKPKLTDFSAFSLKGILMFFIFHFSLLIFHVDSQTITWERTYGRPDPYEEYANSIIQTPDEGYIVVGGDNLEQLPLVLRLNKYGDTIWTRKLPNGGECYKIINTSDGNYAILTPWDYVTKIDINGNIIWLGGPYNSEVHMLNIVQLNDSGFILCGVKFDGPFYDKPHIIKINSNGSFIWEKTYTTNIFDGRLYDVKPLSTNELIFTGSYSDVDTVLLKLFFMKTDLTGNQLFFYGYDTLRYHLPRFIYKTASGNFVAGGTSGYYGAFLISINQNGLIQWYKRYFNYFTEECRSITNTNDGGFALTGWYDSAGYSYQRLIIIKTDSLGNEQWRRIKNSNDYYKGNSIIQTSDNGYVIAGYKNNDMYILKTDELGFNTIGIKQISSEIPYTSKLYQNYPNPFNPSTKIRFSFPLIEGARGRNVHLIIYDLLGREVFTLVNEQLQPGTYEVDWDGTNYASGLYLYRLETGTFVETKKMLLIK